MELVEVKLRGMRSLCGSNGGTMGRSTDNVAGCQKKVFVLGLDGATFDLIKPWVKEGNLPHFRKLMEEGCFGELESVANMRSAAAWTSFMTGKNPDKHGIFEFHEYLPGSYGIRFINGSFRDGKSLWKIVGDQRKKVVVANVPMTYPAEPVNGILISGIESLGPENEGFTYPPELAHEITNRFGKYIVEPGLTGFIAKNKIEVGIRELEDELNQKIALYHYLMKSFPWDFFMIVFRSLDAVQHCFWKFMDPAHPHYNERDARRGGSLILNTYKRIDDFIGSILNELDDDTTLMIMSDHGFGPGHPAALQLDNWLMSKKLLKRNDIYQRKPDTALNVSLSFLLKKSFELLIRHTSRSFKEKVSQKFPRLREKVVSQIVISHIDWKHTKAYTEGPLPNIRVNLKGRESEGIVEVGEYRELVEYLKRELYDCRDSESGERIVDGVFTKEELYDGKYRDRAPDILVRWREDVVIKGLAMKNGWEGKGFSPSFPGEDPRIISGCHHLKGIFLTYGKAVRKGFEIDNARIIDLAPTILYLMGVPVPPHMDGKILDAIFDNNYLDSHPRVYQRPEQEQEDSLQAVEDYSSEEAEKIRERLKALGYIE